MVVWLLNSLLVISLTPLQLFNANDKSSQLNWQIVDDVVMGGRSNGNFYFDDNGHVVFNGSVSTENNGGFSSIRCRMDRKNIKQYTKVVLQLKGDGKAYQFRTKTSSYDRHSYIAIFQTDGSWQTIEIPFDQMYPAFRGRKLNMPNFPGHELEEFAFLIGNKKPENFMLMIKEISLE